MHTGTNHFGHFLLAALLYPSMATNARIINHSSLASSMPQSFPLADLQAEKDYNPWQAYGHTKLANLLFTYEMNHRLAAAGNPKNVIAVAVHPGIVLYFCWLASSSKYTSNGVR